LKNKGPVKKGPYSGGLARRANHGVRIRETVLQKKNREGQDFSIVRVMSSRGLTIGYLDKGGRLS